MRFTRGRYICSVITEKPIFRKKWKKLWQPYLEEITLKEGDTKSKQCKEQMKD